jgi:NHLM bacteriocin system ABC transporter ATP-binding protein
MSEPISMHSFDSAADSAAASSTVSGSTVILDDPQSAWRVEGGSVVVYVQRLGGEAGRRVFLIEAAAGDVVFGAKPGADGVSLVAVAGEDAEVRRLSADERAAVLRSTDGPMRRWVGNVLRVIASDRVPAGRTLTGSGRLPAGESWRPALGVMTWLGVRDGRLRLCGDELREVAPGAPPLIPTASTAWLTTPDGAVVEMRDDVSAEDPADLEAGLSWLHAALIAGYAGEEIRGTERLARRQEFLAAGEDRRMQEAVHTLAQPFEADKPLALVGTELMTVLGVIGRPLRIKFRLPAQTGVEPGADEVGPIAYASGVRTRPVRLGGEWWQRDGDPLLAYLADGSADGSADGGGRRPVALLPADDGGFEIFDPREGVLRPLTAADRANLEQLAVTFYRPLGEPGAPGAPGAQSTSMWGLVRFGFRPYVPQIWRGLAVALAVTFLSLLVPIAARLIIDVALPDANRRLLFEIAALLIAVNLGQAVFYLVRGLISVRLMLLGSTAMQAATWDRLFRLPVRFFREYTSGDLVHRGTMPMRISRSLGATVFATLLTGLLSFLNLGVMLWFSVPLTGFAVLFATIEALVVAAVALGLRRRSLALERIRGRMVGFFVQLIHGISKLRAAGAEGRAFSLWAGKYAEQLRLMYVVQRLYDTQKLIQVLLPGLATTAFYLLARQYWTDATASAQTVAVGAAGAAAGAASGSNPMTGFTQTVLTAGALVGFLTAYRTFSTSLTSLGELAMEVMHSAARHRLAEPILTEPVESEPGQAAPAVLRGEVAIENVYFRYRPDGPQVLQDVSISARPGEFIAVVGPSGSGKSTLIRLLLGFEKPESGVVRYDGKDLNGLDLPFVRQQIGCVMQSAMLIPGSIRDNIAAGHLVDNEQILRAARDAELMDEVGNLPMGLQTIVAERGANFSGGQRQRLMLARALVHNPRVLILDEATSALDETTQARVMANLVRRRVTRIVIAHRLSTVREADRIYVLENGRLVESGRYDELMQQDALFARLVRHQQH